MRAALWPCCSLSFSLRRVLQRTADVPSLAERVTRGEFSTGLGPYPHAEAAAWPQLVSHVSADTLSRAGVPTGVHVVPGDEDLAASRAPGQVVPFFANAARSPRFAPVTQRRIAGMTASEVLLCVMPSRGRALRSRPARPQVTAYNLSSDARLLHALAQHYGGTVDALLGEFQLAFVLFLLLSSLAALEQWKAVLHMARASARGPGPKALRHSESLHRAGVCLRATRR